MQVFIPEYENHNILISRYSFLDFNSWDSELAINILAFQLEQGVAPNLMSASIEVYEAIDKVVQNYRHNVVDDKGQHPAEEERFELAGFEYRSVIVDFTVNEISHTPTYLLIYDEAPVFDGEPEQLPDLSITAVAYDVFSK